MSRATARPLLGTRAIGPVLSGLLLSCGGTAVKPAGDDAATAPGFDTGADGPGPAPFDARPGSSGGSPCDAASQCLTGACTVGVCSEWSHAMLVRVDTTPVGADVHEPVSDFPLLVRLDGSRFPFAQARADGADFRFLDRDGRTLAHEIEWWDHAAALAEVWVLVPRIAAKSADNAVVMYWGNPAATPVSSGPAVFSGFSCVAHMAPAGDGVASHLGDSSLDDRVVAVQNGSTTGNLVRGVAGAAMAFAGTGTYLAARARTAASPVTVSLWLRTTSTAAAGVAAFTNDGLLAHALRLDERGRLAFDVLSGALPRTIASLTGYHDGAWHLVTVRVSEAGQYLFIDGEPVADDPGNDGVGGGPGYWRFAALPALSTGVGGSAYFVGALDEVRIAPSAMSDAWIKLAYATQRPETTAVSYLSLD